MNSACLYTVISSYSNSCICSIINVKYSYSPIVVTSSARFAHDLQCIVHESSAEVNPTPNLPLLYFISSILKSYC